MASLKFATIGTGFWSRFQLAGWKELEGAECVALYNRTLSKAEALGQEFGIEAVYDDLEKLFAEQELDFVDIVAGESVHERFTLMAVERGIPVICQKPLAPDYETAASMARACQEANVGLYVHENWRWQRPLRELKRIMDENRIGRIWRARVIYCCSFPVFENQPFLKELERFILMDIGTHVLDTTRFLFGEATSLHCHTHRVNQGIKGEDAATVMLKMASGATVSVEMSYASRLLDERFPQTYVVIEGEDASIELRKDGWIHVTTREGVSSTQATPEYYPWADARYDCVHASIVDCNRNLLGALQGGAPAETTAEDNLKTLDLVRRCYESAASDSTIVIE